MANFLQRLKKRLNNLIRPLDKFFNLTKQEKNALNDFKIKSVENLSEDDDTAAKRLNNVVKALEKSEKQEVSDKLDLKKIISYFFKEKEGKSILKAFRDASGGINARDEYGNRILFLALPLQNLC